MKIEQLMGFSEVIDWEGESQTEIEKVTHDSRQATKNSLFVAVPGFNTDGHLFIKDAVARGAAAVVIENENYISKEYTWILVPNARIALADFSCAVYSFPGNKMKLIGVTGTNGKTTTVNLIEEVLENAGYKTGLIGTIHSRLGEEIIPVSHTTPESSDLQRLFLTFVEKGANYAVMEVSSHALDLQRVRGVEFDIAVFTNLTQDHLDYHGNMENYLATKGRLFGGLGKNSQKRNRKFAVINVDDQYAERIIEMTSVPVITYGIKNEADVKAKDVSIKAEGAEFTLCYTDRVLPVKLKLAGLFNVYNSLAAIAVGLIEGVPIEKIINVLQEIPGIPGRFEKVENGQDFTVIVDYSHTPDSLENCLKTAREFVKGRVITVFGCGGERDRGKRPLMGEVAGRLSDYSIVTSDNPRGENPQDIIDEILPGVEKYAAVGAFRVIVNRREAIRYAVNMAKAGDVIIIAGKGHETYQIIGSTVLPFDDKKEAEAALRGEIYNEKA